MNKQSLHTCVALAALLSAATAFAGPIEITIEDNAPMYNGFVGNGNPSAAGSTLLAGNGPAKEDNETERVPGRAAIASQEWDLESMVLQGSTLYLIGGFDFLNGLPGGRPGDLFIKVGGAQPGYAPTTAASTVTNGAFYDYTYAVDLSINPAASFGATANMYSLNNNTVLNTVVNDSFRSNPWKYTNNTTSFANTNDGVSTVGISYSTGLSSASILSSYGVNLAGTSHNVLAIDVSFLNSVNPGYPIWFSYTMECGNDSLKGHVPDGGTTAMLIGLAFGAIAIVRRKRILG